MPFTAELHPAKLRKKMGPFARAMMGTAFFRWSGDDAARLLPTWNDFEQDVALFKMISGYLRRLFKDQPELTRLSDHHIRYLQSITSESSLFNALKSESILLSARHQGTVPYDHIYNVLRLLDLTNLPNAQAKVLLVLTALYHDAMKCMAVTYGDENAIQDALLRFSEENKPPAKDSYRGHPSGSALVFLALHWAWQSELSISGITKTHSGMLAEPDLEVVLFLIAYHHFYQEQYVGKSGMEDFVATVVSLRMNPVAILELFNRLSIADLLSVESTENEQWLQGISDMYGQIQALLSQKTIGLATENTAAREAT